MNAQEKTSALNFTTQWVYQSLNGYYYTQVNATDYDNDLSNTTTQQCTFNVCSNNYQQITQPCVNNLRLILYEDTNNCPALISFPSTNGTYQDCTQPTNGLSIDGTLIFLIIVLALIIYTVRLFFINTGKVRAIISLSGVFTLLFGIIFQSIMRSSIHDPTVYSAYIVFTSLIFISGVLMVLLGAMFMFSSDKK
jgi:lipopolysaccharide export LptBFGC system permease protein LptF